MYILICRNMLSSAWMDVPALMCANKGQVHNNNGAEILAAAFMELLDTIPDNGPVSGSLRWAVITGEDSLPKLQLQSLPSDAVSLSVLRDGRQQ
jgi:hypothetical protein